MSSDEINTNPLIIEDNWWIPDEEDTWTWPGVNDKEIKLTAEEGRRPKRKYCYKCNKNNHSLEECFKKEVSKKKECFRCKGDHLVKHCQKKRNKKN